MADPYSKGYQVAGHGYSSSYPHGNPHYSGLGKGKGKGKLSSLALPKIESDDDEDSDAALHHETRSMIEGLDRRISGLERAAVEAHTVRGVWPEQIFINGYSVPCNTRSKSDGLTTVQRAVNCCKILAGYGFHPSYKALRACHYGSVTAREALKCFSNRHMMAPPAPVRAPAPEIMLSAYEPQDSPPLPLPIPVLKRTGYGYDDNVLSDFEIDNAML